MVIHAPSIHPTPFFTPSLLSFSIVCPPPPLPPPPSLSLSVHHPPPPLYPSLPPSLAIHLSLSLSFPLSQQETMAFCVYWKVSLMQTMCLGNASRESVVPIICRRSFCVPYALFSPIYQCPTWN